MLIILLLSLQYLYFIIKFRDDKKFIYILSFASVLTFVFLLILHTELASMGLHTYGSDESDYYETMVNASNITNFSHWWNYVSTDFNTSYIIFGSLILKFSWLNSVFLIRVGNALMFLVSVAMIFNFLKKFKFINKNSQNIYAILFLISTNGIIIWTGIRILKDMMFVYFLIIFFYLFYDLFRNKKLFNLLILPIIILILNDIRQWFIYFLVIFIITLLCIYFIKIKKYFILLITGIISIFILINYAIEGLEILRIYTTERFGTINVMQLPILMAQFLIGPGPIRSFFGNDVFLFTTHTGNFLITIGSFIWWCFIPIFLMALFNKANIKNNFAIFIVLTFYWALYSFANAGSGDTRIRSSFYILAMIYTLPYLENSKSKSFYYIYIILLIIVFTIGITYSYISIV